MATRRNFIKSGVLASVSPLVSIPGLGLNPDGTAAENGFLHEPARNIPVVRETQVIVCGGGPAGIAAAIASARMGVKTTLIELYGCLGGIWTTGLLSNLIDYNNKPGIMKEIADNLEKSGAQYSAKVYDAEAMKVLLDRMCVEAGVEVRFYTRVVGSQKKSGNRLEYIITESFSGREAWKADIFIDATGNGDLAALAGCKFDFGHPESGKTQPGSLIGIITGVDMEQLTDAGFLVKKGEQATDVKKRFFEEIRRAGISASYTLPTLFAIRKDLVAIMANHEYDFSALDSWQVTKATLHARKEVNSIIDGLRSLGGLWSAVRLVASGSQIGIREARRIHGLYTVTVDDVEKGARFDDTVCRVTFSVDVHSLGLADGGGAGTNGRKALPYDIPLRSLIAKDVNGLMMAGRCISGDFFAHASYRVTGNAVAMGEAAGEVAAGASAGRILPQHVKWGK